MLAISKFISVHFGKTFLCFCAYVCTVDCFVLIMRHGVISRRKIVKIPTFSLIYYNSASLKG